ncbi:histidine phosphatase family protein [Nocardiopsis halophila]|uniref:histidine phosphatase family protein n=1 Tax=Nocardiopsis halophila TaxID=141692 RepID=UPI00037E1E57
MDGRPGRGGSTEGTAVTEPTELVVVRHGETVWHRENRYAGSSDVALTENGVRQAEALARWAATAGLSAIVSSTLSRAADTAAPAGEAAGLAVAADPRLVEQDFGDGEGLTSREMRERLDGARERFELDPFRNPLPGSEDPVKATERGVAALADAARAHPGGRVLVVAHGTLIRLVLCRFLGMDAGRYRRAFPKVGNCRGARLRWEEGEVGLLGFNEPMEA